MIDVAAFVALPAAWMGLLLQGATRAAPAIVCLAYAAALLAFRHTTDVRSHWISLLQAPRIVGFAWALLVAMKRRPSLTMPSNAIGIALALGAGVAVACGLWTDWSNVRAIAAMSWIVACAIACVARPG